MFNALFCERIVIMREIRYSEKRPREEDSENQYKPEKRPRGEASSSSRLNPDYAARQYQLYDQRRRQEQQGSGMLSLQDTLASPSQQDIPMPAQGSPDQASTSKVEEIDKAKCDQIVEQLINPPSKRRMMPRINRKEFYEIIDILYKKRDKGEINDEKYNNYRKKMIKKIKNIEHYKDNQYAVQAKQSEYRENNQDAIRAIKAKYYKDNQYAIRAKQSEYRENNQDAIRVRKAEKRVHLYQEALQKATNEIAALVQEIQSLGNQLSFSTDVNQLLVKKQENLIKLKKAKEHYERSLGQNLKKARRVIQTPQELGEAPSHIDLQESLPNARGESSSHHATQEIRPLEEQPLANRKEDIIDIPSNSGNEPSRQEQHSSGNLDAQANPDPMKQFVDAKTAKLGEEALEVNNHALELIKDLEVLSANSSEISRSDFNFAFEFFENSCRATGVRDDTIEKAKIFLKNYAKKYTVQPETKTIDIPLGSGNESDHRSLPEVRHPLVVPSETQYDLGQQYARRYQGDPSRQCDNDENKYIEQTIHDIMHKKVYFK
jgi:hypothetical protein